LNPTNTTAAKKAKGVDALDVSDDIYQLKSIQDLLLKKIVLRGVESISKVIPRKIQNMLVLEEGKYVSKDLWIMDTTGSNLLEVLGLAYIDYKRTYSNDIYEVFDVLGIEAARQVILNELTEVMEFAGVYINYAHLSVLADRMTYSKDMVAVYRSGI
jgi:DNA-directed RNA polymerase II subunit RPB1